jgi:hypothetical protein
MINKETGVKIGLVVGVVIFYLLTCKYQGEDFSVNDYSYLHDNCAKGCKDGDVMKCLDACAQNNQTMKDPNFSIF